MDAALAAEGVHGHIGDRDQISYKGSEFTLLEGRAAPSAPWQLYLYQPATGAVQLLRVRTGKGSGAFANPTVTLLRGPWGLRRW